MGIGDLFKTRAEREKEAAQKRRKAFREAERSVDAVKDRVQNLKNERDKSWAAAREYLKGGQKNEAQRALQSCRASELMMSKLETKRWLFEQFIIKLEMSKTDQEFTESLAAINAVVKVDTDAVADVIDQVQDTLGEQSETDKIWEKLHTQEMAGMKNSMTDTIPTVESMLRQLEDEVAAEVGGASKIKDSDTGAPDINRQIGEGRKRLRDMLDGEKQ